MQAFPEHRAILSQSSSVFLLLARPQKAILGVPQKFRQSQVMPSTADKFPHVAWIIGAILSAWAWRIAVGSKQISKNPETAVNSVCALEQSRAAAPQRRILIVPMWPPGKTVCVNQEQLLVLVLVLHSWGTPKIKCMLFMHCLRTTTREIVILQE